MSSPTFSLDPLLKTTLPKEMAQSVFEDMDFLLRSFFIFITLSITYPVTHRILTSSCTKYADLAGTAKQVTALHHALEGIILTTITPFFSYFIFRINFVSESKDDLGALSDLKDDLRSTFLLCMIIMIMYLFELVSRYERPRASVFIHHLLAILDGYLSLIYSSTVMLKTTSTLVYMICFEAVTFIGLFLYRIAPLSTVTPHVIMTGIIIFVVTRPIQVLWIGAAAFGTWGEPNHDKWQAVMQVVLTCLFTALQLWSTTINYSLWKRCKERIKKKTASSELSQRSNSDGRDDLGWLEDENQAGTPDDVSNEKNETMLKEGGAGPDMSTDCSDVLTVSRTSREPQQSHDEKRKKSLARRQSQCIYLALLLLLVASVITVTMTPFDRSSISAGSFMDFAITELEAIERDICQTDDFSIICDDIDELRSVGRKYDALPRHDRLNYQAMTITYPLIPSLVDINKDEDSQFTLLRVNYLLRALRITRTLGLGNSLRLQGHNEGTVNEAYWDHINLLLLQDKNLQPPGNGIESLCGYVSSEYEVLKVFANKNFDGTLAPPETFVTKPDAISPMYRMCTSDNILLSYLVRNDWEHHHREATNSMMNKEYTERIVTHTIWYWESLFALNVSPDTAIPTMMKSFDALLP